MNRATAILFSIIGFGVNGQSIISGKVLHGSTREPIAYANIGIPNSNVGSISNPDGTFSIRIPQNHQHDTLSFSALGFGFRKVAVAYFQQGKEAIVLLNEKHTLLNEVVITDRKQKNRTYELGNRRVRGGVLETDTLYAGGSTALLIDGSQQKEMQFPVYLEKVQLRIFKNNLSECKFRLRLNDVDPTGKPGRDLLEKSIVVESDIRKRWLTFYLSSLYILVEKPFFITFEQILDLNDRTKIADGYREFMLKHPDKIKIDTIEFEGKKEVRKLLKGFALDLPGTFVGINPGASEFTCYVRETSFGEWTKVRGIVSAFVTVSDQQMHAKKENTKCDLPACKAEQICRDFMDETGLNGMQLCVRKNNKILFSLNLGHADIKNKIPVTAETRFRINSVSKSITSAALMKLVQEKKLDLDEPVQKYVPTFPKKKYSFTTRQLGGHLAAIRDYNENDLADFIRTVHFSSATDALRVFQNDSLLFEPGTQFHYTTFGWNLIGAVIEGVSNMNFLDYLQENVLTPLQLEHTCADDATATIPTRSKFYDEAGLENDYGDLSYKYAGGGLLSTAEDLSAFGNELLNGRFLDDPSKKILFESQRTTDQKETGYGIGWYVGLDKNGNRIWHHAGDSFSSSSHLILYPDQNIVISFLGNSQVGATFDIQRIADLVIKK